MVFKHLKCNKKNEGHAVFGATKSLAFGETVKEKRIQLFESFFLDRRSVSQGIKCNFEVLKGDEPSWLLTKRKLRVDSLSEGVKNCLPACIGLLRLVDQQETRRKRNLKHPM